MHAESEAGTAYSYVPFEEVCVVHAEGEAGTAYSYILQQPEVRHLVLTALVVKQYRRFLLVRLDAAHIVRLLQSVQTLDRSCMHNERLQHRVIGY